MPLVPLFERSLEILADFLNAGIGAAGLPNRRHSPDPKHDRLFGFLADNVGQDVVCDEVASINAILVEDRVAPPKLGTAGTIYRFKRLALANGLVGALAETPASPSSDRPRSPTSSRPPFAREPPVSAIPRQRVVAYRRSLEVRFAERQKPLKQPPKRMAKQSAPAPPTACAVRATCFSICTWRLTGAFRDQALGRVAVWISIW
ncbi:MAG: hypothetical protein AAGD13_01925 [Pseudomonadota bacterium]